MDRDVASPCQNEILHRGFKLCKRNGAESGTLVKFAMGTSSYNISCAVLVFPRENETGLDYVEEAFLSPCFFGSRGWLRANSFLVVSIVRNISSLLSIVIVILLLFLWNLNCNSKGR